MSDSIPSDAPRPRLCHLRKWPDFSGYGFNLHAERGKTGHYVGSIDRSSPAEAAGLHVDDRIVEVNGVNIGNENHRQVVERVKAVANETKLLVIDRAGDSYYQENKIVITSDMSNVLYLETPVTNPYTAEQGMQWGDAAEVSSVKSNSSDSNIPSHTTTSGSHITTSGSHSTTSGSHITTSGSLTTSGSQGNGLDFPTSVKEAREKMSKKRNVKTAGMTLKDKYDLLQQL